MNNGGFAGHSGHSPVRHANAYNGHCQPKPQRTVPRPQRDIVLMSEEETADWIYDLAVFQKWD